MITDSIRYMGDVHKSAEYIKRVIDDIPQICVVLGTGLAPLAEIVESKVVIPYNDIPYFPIATAPGHEGMLVYGELCGAKVFMMNGRYHYYEGYDLSVTSFYVRVMAHLGVKTLVVTNASGGIKDGLTIPTLMIINDHISFFCDSALRGPNLDDFGVRFPDQSAVYDPEYIEILQDICRKYDINYATGVYAYCKGPQYETPAEIRALKVLGADAVGMSTVPEVQVAVHSGMRVAGISCIANLAAGISKNPLSAEEVFENMTKIADRNCLLIKEFIKAITK